MENIGRTLSKPVKVYILGGAALTLRGIKESTLDIDIIVEDSNSYKALIEAFPVYHGYHGGRVITLPVDPLTVGGSPLVA